MYSIFILILDIQGGDIVSELSRFKIYILLNQPGPLWLTGIDLSGAMLNNANLIGANLYGANLKNVELISANLTGADLREADLRHAQLFKTNMTGADLRGANVHNAKVRQIILKDAKVSPRMNWPHQFDPRVQGAIVMP